MKFTTVFAAILLCPLLTRAQDRQQNEAKLDSIFHDWTGDGPGGVVSVVDHDSVIYQKAFGLADLAEKIPNSINMKYDLASITKQFTAFCIALLEEQGKISTDDNIKKFYPDIRIREEIRVRNLLDHTSGLREASVLAILSGKMNLKGEVRKKYNTKKYYLECLHRETDLNFPPGSELAYTNFNYILLADIVEKASGQNFSEFADSAIFRPLGMNHTIFRDRRKMKIENAAPGYRFTGKKFRLVRPMGGIVGDHNLLSTVEDLAKWQRNFSNNKLGKETQSLIGKITTASTLTNGSSSHYAYGLYSNVYRGAQLISHGGDDGRHTSFMMRFPDHDLAIIVLSNSARYWQAQDKAFKIADVLIGKMLEPAQEKSAPLSFIQLPAAKLKSKAGLYSNVDEKGLAAILKITFEDGRLFVSRNYVRRGLELKPVDSLNFVATNDLGYRIDISFPADSTGVVVEKFRDKSARYKILKNASPVFAEYSGIFHNSSTGATIKVKRKKGKIVGRKGVIRIPLVPFGEDKFYAIQNDALFAFARDNNGKIKSVKVNAPDFRNFTFMKTK